MLSEFHDIVALDPFKYNTIDTKNAEKDVEDVSERLHAYNRKGLWEIVSCIQLCYSLIVWFPTL